MQAFEMRDRSTPPQNFVARGLNRVSEAFGRPSKPTEPIMELHRIPGEPVAKIVFGEMGKQASIHIIWAMAQETDPHTRLEDNFTLQMALGEQTYHTQYQDGQPEEAMVVMSDVLAMVEIRSAYRDFGVADLLERDLPTPEKMAEAIEKVHQQDEELKGHGIIFFGNKHVATNITPIRRMLHKYDPSKLFAGTLEITSSENPQI